MKDLSKQQLVKELVQPEKDAFIEWYTDEFNHDWKIHDLRNKPKIAEETIKTIKKLKFTYCFYQLFNDIDVCSLICDKI